MHHQMKSPTKTKVLKENALLVQNLGDRLDPQYDRNSLATILSASTPSLTVYACQNGIDFKAIPCTANQVM